MPFIGNKPSAVPLTSADIADGIITSAKIVDGTIVNADINASSAITLNKISGNPNFRNRIINGNMTIDQRNAGASINNAAADATQYSLDRWTIFGTQASKFTAQQNAAAVTPPTGFKNYLGITSSSAYTVGASESFSVRQRIEGFNTSDLDFGTASASTVTLSFYIRSSLTGSFGGVIYNEVGNRFYPFSYTILSANTWEKKTITIAGDTSGTWVGATNGIGLIVQFSLGAGATVSGTANAWTASVFLQPTGSTSVVGTNGATFYLTGVQLEAGTNATDFEFLPIDVSLDRCLRYYEQLGVGSFAMANDTTSFWTSFNFRKRKRGNPTASLLTQSFEMTEWGLATNTTTSATIVNSYLTNNDAVYVQLGGFTSVTAGDTATPTSTFAESNGLRPFIAFNSEL